MEVMNKFTLDLDRLHKQALGEFNGRRSGRTIYQYYLMIGIAQLETFSFLENKKVVYIVFDKPVRMICQMLKELKEICEYEEVFCEIGKEYKYIQIDNTVFAFVRVTSEVEHYPTFTKDIDWVWWNSDFCWDLSIDKIEEITNSIIANSTSTNFLTTRYD